MLQASRLNMAIIPGVLDIMPEQMQMVNPALILILLPLFDRVIYPLFSKLVFLRPTDCPKLFWKLQSALCTLHIACSSYMFRCGILKRPLDRMVVGGLLTASAFFISGFLGTVSRRTSNKKNCNLFPNDKYAKSVNFS
jgi:hypothetical protein